MCERCFHLQQPWTVLGSYQHAAEATTVHLIWRELRATVAPTQLLTEIDLTAWCEESIERALPDIVDGLRRKHANAIWAAWV